MVHLNNLAEYDIQKLGKISSLDFTFHLKNVRVSPNTKVHHALVIQQNGLLFRSPKAKLGNTADWHGFVINDMTPRYFKRIKDNTPGQLQAHPDFTASGPIQFGYAVYVSSRSKEGCEVVTGVDNWRVTVMHAGGVKKGNKKFNHEKELQERQRLEKLLIEEKLNTEQEVRRARLKAEEEIRKMQLQVEHLQRKKERKRNRTSSSLIKKEQPVVSKVGQPLFPIATISLCLSYFLEAG